MQDISKLIGRPAAPFLSESSAITRRELLRRLGAVGVALGAGNLLAACVEDGSVVVTETTDSAPGESSRRGGRLRIGVTGGGTAENLDAHVNDNEPDIARAFQLYEPLAIRDTDYMLTMVLAESIEPENDGSVWIARLKEGVEFHNGQTVTADDVIFSLRRIADPDDPKSGAAALGEVDLPALEALDERTVRIPLAVPNAGFVDQIGQYFMGIVPTDYDPRNPIGTGPFKAESFTVGDRSTFSRHENYWRGDVPYIDELDIISFVDDAARLSALQAGQIEAMSNLAPTQYNVVDSDPRLRVLEAETGNFQPLTMRVDGPPFDDPRVRQAFRLLVDRREMIDQALDGHGRIANDMYSPFDSCFASEIPQREYDPDQARALLRDAGVEDLTVDLVTAPIYQGIVEAAQVFAEQAQRAGVNVQVDRRETAAFYDEFLTYPLSQSYWFTRPYLAQAAQSTLPDAAFNETHWNDAEWLRVVEEARSTVDEDQRCELLHEAQRIEHERGGYIIYAFSNQLDAYSENLKGILPSRSGVPLGNYDFREAQLSG